MNWLFSQKRNEMKRNVHLYFMFYIYICLLKDTLRQFFFDTQFYLQMNDILHQQKQILKRIRIILITIRNG